MQRTQRSASIESKPVLGNVKLLFKIFALGLVFSSSLQAAFGAEPPSSAKLSLNIQDAVQMALERNPDIRAGREKLVESEESLAYTTAQIFPNISAVGSAIRQKNSVVVGSDYFGGTAYNQYSVALRATQPLYQGGLLTNGISLAKKDQEIRKKDLEILERDLTVSVIQAFYNVLTNQQLLELLRNQQELQRRAMATADRYYRIGRGPLVDVLQLKTQLALLTPRIANTEAAVKTAAAQLATLLHETQSSVLELNLKGVVPVIDPKSVPGRPTPLSELPEVIRSETAVSQFSDRIGVQMAPNYPRVDLVGSIGRSAYIAADLLNDFATNWSFGLQLNIPLYSGLSSLHQRRVYESQKVQMEFAHQKLLDNLSFSQSKAIRDLKVAQANVESTTEAEGYASALLKESERTYRLQISDLLKFLAAQQSYLDAEINFIDAKYRYVDAVTRYFSAFGLPMEELITRLMEKALPAKESA